MTEHAMDDHRTISVLDVDQATAEGGGLPLFAVTFRGYDRYEVEQHLADLDLRLNQLAADRDASLREVEAARAQLATVDAVEAVSGFPTYKAMGERIARLFTIAEEEVAAMKAAAALELERAHRDAERITAAAAGDRQALLDDAAESVRQMKDEATRQIAEVDDQIAQARARAESTAAAPLAELDRRLEAREAAAHERLAEVTREYDDVSGRLRQIAAQISVVDGPTWAAPADTAETEILPTEPPPATPEY
jgi:colicin import membrane protein